MQLRDSSREFGREGLGLRFGEGGGGDPDRALVGGRIRREEVPWPHRPAPPREVRDGSPSVDVEFDAYVQTVGSVRDFDALGA